MSALCRLNFVCDQFLKWGRAHMLLSDPFLETVKQHRAVLSLLLRFLPVMCRQAQAAGIDSETVSVLALRPHKARKLLDYVLQPHVRIRRRGHAEEAFPR